MEPRLSDLTGAWVRSLLVETDGGRDTTTAVWWFQASRLYIDLRQAPDRPDFCAATALDRLTPAQVAWLARQCGFAGELRYDRGCFEWQREIDFQLTAPCRDQGHLRFVGDVLVETGKNSPYVEHWHRAQGGDEPVCALRLEDSLNGCRGFLVRIGERFMYARGRSATFAADASLAERIASAPTLAAAQDLIDCEISEGGVTAAGWTIRRSTLPFREGASLAPRLSDDHLIVADVDRRGTPYERRWSVLAVEGRVRSCFDCSVRGTVCDLRPKAVGT
jgi:hypothetical protein